MPTHSVWNKRARTMMNNNKSARNSLLLFERSPIKRADRTMNNKRKKKRLRFSWAFRSSVAWSIRVDGHSNGRLYLQRISGLLWWWWANACFRLEIFRTFYASHICAHWRVLACFTCIMYMESKCRRNTLTHDRIQFLSFKFRLY